MKKLQAPLPQAPPPEIQQALDEQNAPPPEDYSRAPAISPEDVPDDVARAMMTPQEYEEHRKQVQYGVGIGNVLQTTAEAAARSATLGISDYALTALGADPEGLREREARNEVAAGVGTAIGIIAPALLTGGASGAELGLAGTLAEVTPAALVSRVGAATAKAITTAGGESLMARIASHTARAAIEGAIFGAGARLSGRVLNGEDAWDPDAAGEYLAAAGEGALIGGALGAGGAIVGEAVGAAARGVKAIGARVAEGLNAPVDAAKAELTAVQAADYESRLRGARQRLESLTSDQFAPELPQMRAEAAAKWQAALSSAESLPETGIPKAAMRADAPLEQLHATIAKEADELGVSKEATRTAWDRLTQGREALANLDADHAATAKRIVQIGDELELRGANALDELSLSRRNDAIRKALATDTSAAPTPKIVEAFGQQVDRVKSVLSEFLEDPDPQLKSYARKLDKFIAAAGKDVASLDPSLASSGADAYETLDQLNRTLGRVRAKLGDRSALGIGTMSEQLSSLYEENRQLLKNPNIVGDQAAAIGARAKAAWTDVFDSSAGYRKALLASDSGGARLASGFETADRFDPAKVAKWLRTINDPESQLQLELVARGLDSQSKLLRTFAEDLAPTAGAAENIEAYQARSKELVDAILGYRSRAGLAAEYAQTVAPAVKEAEALEGKIAAAQAKADTRLASEQLRAQDLVTAEAGKAEEARAAAVQKAQQGVEQAQDKVRVGVARLALHGVGMAIGGHMGGALGALAGETLANQFIGLTTPIMRRLANAGLESAVRTDSTMQLARTAARSAQKIAAATAAIGQAMHGGALPRIAAKVVIEQGELKARYDQAKKQIENAVPPDAVNDSAPRTTNALAQTQTRAQAFLAQAMPKEHRPLGMRSDLDKLAAPERLEMRRWLRQVAAVRDPASVLHAVARGEADAASLAAVRAVYPKLMQRVAEDISAHGEKLQKQPPMSVQVAVGQLLGQPVHFTQTPDFARFAQSAYQQQAAPPQPRRPTGIAKNTGAQPGSLERAEAL